MGLNVHDMTPGGGGGGGGAYMEINVLVMCKYICNRVNLIVKGPHV
jgi:hypothetical protein